MFQCLQRYVSYFAHQSSRSFTSWRIITLKRASRRARQRSNAEELSEKTVRSSSESRLGYSTVLDTLLERVKGATFGKSSQQEELYATLHDFENELQEKNELLEECMVCELRSLR